MAGTKRAAAKKAPAKKSAAPSSSSTRTPASVARRVESLEREVVELRTQLDNIARFIAAGVAQQLQAQLMANPAAQQQLAAALAAAQGNQS
ncbi:hypothetical protein BI023_gp25 [Mycobacterium phage Sneeze]|uniref:Uncharacterized protein n=1 Tax=Mycobacterium phage Rabbs TaxID=2530143 RepID=A0A481VT20_9CAUD|nr:hypothetical protein BI023_gp25 [Mycobacterium phage Sneeze]YP_010051370.1 hypothetical protein KDW71_gp25 [Mycobacterium phage Rabbs]ANU79738.1 hypothetical protein SEA_SNEEZE_25 [Mycobacterium phage Sneeze]QBI96778.1 hypothetical protein SEA_RABBS_25 [Mycobacterium phage Rabbs]